MAVTRRTGDTAELEGDPPYWRILGRTSVDIIKSGGYKISAPAIEDVLLSHDSIRECAVLGIPDETMGEAIAAVVAWEGDHVSPPAHHCFILGRGMSELRTADLILFFCRSLPCRTSKPGLRRGCLHTRYPRC